ncbi:hypothetical protein CbuG_1651 [Coxiella burnetii CbuG_Q212]|nr:hypothetical protein CbuG_1651 [Coxiella burnetii CbuG_Q212]EDR36219.1 hypothetical protein COXBURSA334_1721 [Coxiella burnetii Q321]
MRWALKARNDFYITRQSSEGFISSMLVSSISSSKGIASTLLIRLALFE